jgi:signal transduction histidine kinase/ligand-binding sensor domain-containing protein
VRLALACLVIATATARAEHWPIRAYTTADGLANDRVDRIARDDRGFLWFATLDGVTRFDGHDMASFGVADGLPAAMANDVLAARDGTIWVATEGGLAWFDPRESATAPRFHALPLGETNCLTEDRDGTLWAGVARGLVRIERGARVAAVPVALGSGRQPKVIAIAADPRDRSLWLGTWSGLWHRAADGAVEQHAMIYGADDRVFGLLLDHRGRLWIGDVGTYLVGVVTHPRTRLAPPGAQLWDFAARGGDWLRYMPESWTRRGFCEDSDGTIWAGTTGDLVRYDGAFTEIGRAQVGIEWAGLSACVEDTAGNLWFGSNASGAVRLARPGLTTFDRADGLDRAQIEAFVEAGGELYIVTESVDGHMLNHRSGDRFVALRPHLPPGVTIGAWGFNQSELVDRDGRWWFPTGQGVGHYPRVARFEDLATAEPRFFGVRDGLPGRDVYRLYEDRRGDVWISVMSDIGLVRWDHASDAIVTAGAGWPHAVATAFAEDAAGALWVGFGDGELYRKRDGAPARVLTRNGQITALLVDAAHRLWVASEGGGVVRIDDVAAPRPQAIAGLASQQVLTLVDDTHGRIYLGTSRGIDRIDPSTGEVTHIGRADGLPNEFIVTARRTRDGALWFGTRAGAARLVPSYAPPKTRAPTYLIALAIAGERRALPAGGARELAGFELAPDEDRLDVTVTSPSFVLGEQQRFQYRLDRGGDAGAWSAPVGERALHFAKLAPGAYRLEVRAIYPDGSTSPAASLAFAVLPPIWMRWWFVALVAAALAAAAYVLYRWRLGHALAVERVRTRIATDLHDELGANLSRISILSEVARRGAAGGDVTDKVDEIGKSARELVDVASDIVWSTDPRRDDLRSIVVRLRAFAGDVLEARGIAWRLDAPAEPERIKLAPDRRRHFYLVVKEAIHNAARHSGAANVAIAIAHADGALEAIVRDDGRGFAATDQPTGNGLANMRARAADAGGTLDLRTSPGGGTEVCLRIPMRGRG